MAHKLVPPLRKVDRILKNRLFTGNLNLFVQAQPKLLEARRFISQSGVYFSNKPKEESSGGSRLEGKERWPNWVALTCLGAGLGYLKKDYEVSKECLNEDLNVDLNEDLNVDLNEDLNVDLNEDLNVDLNEDLNVDLNEDLNGDLNEDRNVDLNEDYNWKGFVDNFKGRGTVEKAERKINDVATEDSNCGVGINRKKLYGRFILHVIIPVSISSGIDFYIDKYWDTSRKVIPAKALRLLRFCGALCSVWAAYNFTLTFIAIENERQGLRPVQARPRLKIY